MPQTTYNLHLKGFVGGADFDRNYVDYILGKHAGKPVNVLIDSLGGSVATALSIASAFRNHADVCVHFVGMNASAATIASLGAKHISIDTNAMYLVHKCSQGFIEWGSLNADQFATLIADCQQIKADRDKTIADLQAQIATLKAQPADTSTQIVDTAKQPPTAKSEDPFNGWGTILDEEITAGNIASSKGNLLTLTDAITSANAVDVAKEIERSCHPHLRRLDKFLFCDPSFADKYNDAYLLTHAGISYNTKYNQSFIEGSNNKTTLVPLDCLAGTDKFIVTPKNNMLYGYDNMSDTERLEVKRYQPWVITLAAAMFFGCQFHTIDERYLKVVHLKTTE